MKRKRNRRRHRNYMLYENSVLRTMNKEQRSQADRKDTIIIPPILLVENVRHGVFNRRALFDFKNTVNIPHWSELVKLDLLDKTVSRGRGVLTKVPLTTIYDEPDAERVKMEQQALSVANMMDAEAYQLKCFAPILQRDSDPLLALCKKHEEIADTDLLREFNQANRKSSAIDKRTYTPIVAGRNDKRICEIRKYLTEYKALNKIDTLAKASQTVDSAFFEMLSPLALVLDILDEVRIISVTDAQRQHIIDRYTHEKSPSFNKFAPYASVAIRLYLTMALYLMENPVNTLTKEVLRDYDYLYYVLPSNVTFVSADKAHKKFIDEIPCLRFVRDRFLYIDKRNDPKMREGLKRLGIQV